MSTVTIFGVVSAIGMLLVGSLLVTFKLGKKDFTFLYKGIMFKRREKEMIKNNILIADVWKECYQRRRPTDVAIDFVDTKTSYTYDDIEKQSNQLGHYFTKYVKTTEVIGIFMQNKPEYFITWLGGAKIGVRSALINFNLRHKALVHSISVSQSKILIYDKELEEALEEIRSELDPSLIFICADGESKLGLTLQNELKDVTSSPLPLELSPQKNGVKIKDPVLYVYTSGTTGLPKAAVVNHHRLGLVPYGFGILFNLLESDVVYCTLPLYHSAGGIIGLGAMLSKNCRLVIRKKFSASNFLSDVREYNCTVAQYIGELCRYILATPEKPDDRDNKLRLILGNGLRPDVWKRFQERFGIKQVGEFYAATEGASGLFNTENEFGAIGFISPLVQPLLPVRLVKFDHQTEELVRDSRGFCIPCAENEPGEFIAKIYETQGIKNFSGYTNQEASNKKVASNVFKTGDQWFRSGDLLRQDSRGFVYFVDRIGDTFRWKGENCSTAEISEIMSNFIQQGEVNVYGVEIPGKDGRAGMASIAGVEEASFDFEGLATHVNSQLPTYARPLFLRFLPEIEITGTFKHKKVELRDQGFNPSTISDPLFFFDGKSYVRLTPEIYDRILAGEMRV